MMKEVLLVVLVFLGASEGNYWGNPYCSGGRDVITHLFEWKWTDIASECSWLAANGYCAVQVLCIHKRDYRLVQNISNNICDCVKSIS